MDVVNDQENGNAGIKRSKERNAVFGINDDVKMATEFKQIVNGCPEVNSVKAAAANYLNAFNHVVSGALAVITSKNGDA